MIGIGFAAGMTLAQKALRIGIAVAVIAALLALSYCQGRTDGKNGERLRVEQARSKQLERAGIAGDKADEQRQQDQAVQQEVEKQYEQAIESAPGGSNSPAAVALACRRLLQSGYSGADLPAQCRS